MAAQYCDNIVWLGLHVTSPSIMLFKLQYLCTKKMFSLRIFIETFYLNVYLRLTRWSYKRIDVFPGQADPSGLIWRIRNKDGVKTAAEHNGGGGLGLSLVPGVAEGGAVIVYLYQTELRIRMAVMVRDHYGVPLKNCVTKRRSLQTEVDCWHFGINFLSI